jgi:hypothetical protein
VPPPIWKAGEIGPGRAEAGQRVQHRGVFGELGFRHLCGPDAMGEVVDHHQAHGVHGIGRQHLHPQAEMPAFDLALRRGR